LCEKGISGPVGLLCEFDEGGLSLRAALELKQPSGGPL
jgi:hypothetical protein